MSKQGKGGNTPEDSGQHRILVTGKLPVGWLSEKYWLDLVPGASVELPGAIVFTCYLDNIDGAHRLRLAYRLGDDDHEFSAVLGVILDLSVLAGMPCVLIPRAIRPKGCEAPAAVLLEFARVPTQ